MNLFIDTVISLLLTFFMLFIYDQWIAKDPLDSIVQFDRFVIDSALQEYSMDIIKNNPENDWKIMQKKEHVKENLKSSIDFFAQGRIVINSGAILSGKVEDITNPILGHLGLPFTTRAFPTQAGSNNNFNISPLFNVFTDSKSKSETTTLDEAESIIP